MMVPIVEAVLGEIKNESIKNQLERKENDNSQTNEVSEISKHMILLYDCHLMVTLQCGGQ